MRVGVISDTRPQAMQALEGSEHILHAGDVGDPAILDALRSIAPVTAIRGNIDEGGRCSWLQPIQLITLQQQSIYMLHDVQQLDLNPEAAGIAVVISGHSHKPLIEVRRGVLYLNPGSAGPRRFTLPVSVAALHLGEGAPHAEIVELQV